MNRFANYDKPGTWLMALMLGAILAGCGGSGNATRSASTTTSLTSSVSQPASGQMVTFTATVTSSGATPSGDVSFKDGATTIGSGTLNGAGAATFSTSTLSVGNHSITAVYAGNASSGTSTSSVLIQATGTVATATTLTSSVNPAISGQMVTFTATTTSAGATPSGTVNFNDGTTALGVGVMAGPGIATFSTSALTAGDHSITAVYAGNNSFSNSTSSALVQTTGKAATTTTVTSSINPSVSGQRVAFTAKVTGAGGTPAGDAIFKDGASAIGSGIVNGAGVAVFSTSALSVGSHSITAVYSGNNSFSSSTSSALIQAVGTVGGHGPAPVLLGAAGNFAILAKAGISDVPTSAITGNIGVSPIAATAITGFALTLDATNVFSTSSQVTGKVYAADYAGPTPVNLTTAVSDMQTAYVDAAGRTLPDYTELGAGNIGRLLLRPGLYKWSSDVTIPTSVTLTGASNDVWIFQVAGGVTEASTARVILAGGAQAKNVFWQVAGTVAIGTTAHMEGEVLSQTAITLATGASVNGSLLAQTAVTLDGNTVVKQ